MDTNQNTFFASPERSSLEKIYKENESISKVPLVQQFLEGFPNLAVILNHNRQIVAYNKKAENILFKDDSGEIYGQRLGEALRCIHAWEMSAGCGTSRFCTECGAGKSIYNSLNTLTRFSDECRITIETLASDPSLDLRVFSSVLTVENETYILFSIEDIKDEKRRRVLEKIFFHDILNTTSVIRSSSELLKMTDNLTLMTTLADKLINASDQLIGEIQAQRDLINAENGTLTVNYEITSVNKIISTSYDLYKDHALSNNEDYILELLENDIYISTDHVLLVRSLGNLIKNALEATVKNNKVKIFSIVDEDSVKFNVQNDGVIPEKIQLLLFQRSFSTKASCGRGVGLYGVKLFVEQYLNGSVSFVSSKETGTIFTLKFPTSGKY